MRESTRMIPMSVGVAMILIGGLWFGQGLGWIRWPASSFMIAAPQWSFYGAALALIGAVLIWWANKKSR